MLIKPSEWYFLQHQDSKLLCDHNKTDYKPPKDIQFEEYGSKHTLPRQPASETKGKKGKSIFTGNKKKKKVWSKPLTSIENEIEWSNAVNFKINNLVALTLWVYWQILKFIIGLKVWYSFS